MAGNLTDILTSAEGLGVSVGILPPATNKQPSQATGSPSFQAAPSGMTYTGGAAPTTPPPTVPTWVWYAGAGVAALVVVGLLLRK